MDNTLFHLPAGLNDPNRVGPVNGGIARNVWILARRVLQRRARD